MWANGFNRLSKKPTMVKPKARIVINMAAIAAICTTMDEIVSLALARLMK